MAWTAPTLRITGELITAAIWNTDLVADLLLLKTSMDDSGSLAPPARTTLTLATDACTPTQNAHAVDTEAAAASDNLSTLTIAGNIRSGHLLILSAANVAHVVTVKDGVGNISLLGGDCVLGSTKSFLLLQLVGTTWFEITRALVAPVVPTSTFTATGTASITVTGLDLDTDWAYEFLVETTDTAGNTLTAQLNGSAATSVDATMGTYVNQAGASTPYGVTGQNQFNLSLGQTSRFYGCTMRLFVGIAGDWTATFQTTLTDLAGTRMSVTGSSERSLGSGNVTSVKFAIGASTCNWRVIVRKLKS